MNLTTYQALRAQFTVTRAIAQDALAWAQPFAMEALGVHTRRQTLVEGELPAYIVVTTSETNGGWGELMPVWFKCRHWATVVTPRQGTSFRAGSGAWYCAWPNWAWSSRRSASAKPRGCA